jgi:hypothetical protein
MKRHFKTVNYPAWAWRNELPGKTEEERDEERRMIDEFESTLPDNREEETDGHTFFCRKPVFGPPAECVVIKIWETE